MGTGNGDGKKLTPECMALVAEGIHLILSRWTALQLALQYRSYDKFSCQREKQLHADIFSWFTQSKESMSDSFGTDVDDESPGEVALHLMIMHEECSQSKGSQAVSQSTLIVNEDDDSNDNSELVSDFTEMLVIDPKENKTVEVEEGWCVVGAKKS